jgi:hypothetical protein
MLRFLVDFYTQRRIYRKQIAAVVTELLHVDSWLDALRKEAALCELPGDFAQLLSEREQERKEEAEYLETEDDQATDDPSSPNRTPQSSMDDAVSAQAPPLAEIHASDPSMPSSSPKDRKESRQSKDRTKPKRSHVRAAIRKAADPAGISLPIRAELSGSVSGGVTQDDLDAVCALLEQALSEIEACGFTASDADKAATAFETFRRAVVQVVSGTISKIDGTVIERIEPKPRILQFLVDMYERHQKFRSRITSTLMRLLNFDGWRAAADEDQSVHAVVHDFQDMRKVSTMSAGGTMLTLTTVAATAVKNGGVGALYVQILAGYDLRPADSNGTSDPYARARVGGRTQRTHVITDTLNPTWNANPFIFEVQSFEASLKIEVLDSDFFKDDPLGDVEVSLAHPPVSDFIVVRRLLDNAPHGEIEVKLLFVAGEPGSSQGASQAGYEIGTRERAVTLSQGQKEVGPGDESSSRARAAPACATPWTPWGPVEAVAKSGPTTPRQIVKPTNPFAAKADAAQGSKNSPRNNTPVRAVHDIWGDVSPRQAVHGTSAWSTGSVTSVKGSGSPPTNASGAWPPVTAPAAPVKPTNPFLAEPKPAAPPANARNPFAQA